MTDLLDSQTEALIADCENIFGKIDERCRNKIRRAIMAPGADTWQAAHNVVIAGTRVLWEATMAVDDRMKGAKIAGPYRTLEPHEKEVPSDPHPWARPASDIMLTDQRRPGGQRWSFVPDPDTIVQALAYAKTHWR